MRHRSIIAILFIVGGLWLAGCTDPSVGATSAPGATSPPSPAPATKGDYGY